MSKTDPYVPEDELTDEEIDARIAARTPKSRKPPPPRKKSDFLPFEEARTFVREQMLPSRSKYQEWWEREKPKTLPRFPYRVYKNWISWNDFLGTNNKFNEKIGTAWRPLKEAVLYTHTLKLATMNDWLAWAREEGNLPADLPARPDLVYKDWRGWGHWLGNRVAVVVEAKQEVTKRQVFYMIHEQNTPENVILVGVEPMGLPALRDRWDRDHYDIVKFFWYEESKAADIKRILDTFSSPYYNYDRQRLMRNAWEVIYYLQNLLEVVTPQQLVATKATTVPTGFVMTQI